jgi:methylated-DNA-[protein]-cysteine S-methyltransferase
VAERYAAGPEIWWMQPSPLGWMAWTSSAAGLRALRFGYARRAELVEAAGLVSAVSAGEPELATADLAARLQRLARGETTDLSDLGCDLQRLGPFARRVLQACQAIPWGEVRSYGELAVEIGSPAAARAVGTALARNPLPLVIPCHRVVGHHGRLGGFSAPGGLATKARLLELEGHDLAAMRGSAGRNRPTG